MPGLGQKRTHANVRFESGHVTNPAQPANLIAMPPSYWEADIGIAKMLAPYPTLTPIVQRFSVATAIAPQCLTASEHGGGRTACPGGIEAPADRLCPAVRH